MSTSPLADAFARAGEAWRQMFTEGLARAFGRVPEAGHLGVIEVHCPADTDQEWHETWFTFADPTTEPCPHCHAVV